MSQSERIPAPISPRGTEGMTKLETSQSLRVAPTFNSEEIMGSPTDTSPSLRVVTTDTNDAYNMSPRSVSLRKSMTSEIEHGSLEVITESNDDSSPSNRVKNFKAQFIEVYVGAQVFADVGLNVVVAIYLQAADRLYEVVMINKDTSEEISRFYVFEDQLAHQMNNRLNVLKAVCADGVVELAPTQKSRRGTLAPAKFTSSVTNAINNGNTSEGAQRRNTCLPSIPGTQSLAIKRHTISTSVQNAAQSAHQSSSAGYRNDLLKDTELGKIIYASVNDSPLMTKAPHVARPVLYFGLREGSQITPPLAEQYQKVNKNDLISKPELLDGDLSASALKDISFYASAIVSSLYVRSMAQEKDQPVQWQFVLYDAGSNRFFTILKTLPSKESALALHVNSEATVVDPATVIAKINFKEDLETKASDMSTVHDLLESAIGHQDQTTTGLNALKEPDGRNRLYVDNINPNTNKYRSMWQAAYITVVAKLAEQKHLRAEWDRVIQLHKEQAAHEALLNEHRQKGKFRSLATGKSDFTEMTPDDIQNYRNSLAIKKRKQNKSGGRGLQIKQK